MCIQTKYFTLTGYFLYVKKYIILIIIYFRLKKENPLLYYNIFIYLGAAEISRTALATDPQTKMQHFLIRFLTVPARLRERYSGHKSYFKSFQIDLVYALVQLVLYS